MQEFLNRVDNVARHLEAEICSFERKIALVRADITEMEAWLRNLVNVREGIFQGATNGGETMEFTRDSIGCLQVFISQLQTNALSMETTVAHFRSSKKWADNRQSLTNIPTAK